MFHDLQSFLGQKYGETLLPIEMGREDMEAILSAMREDHETYLGLLAERAARRKEDDSKRLDGETTLALEVVCHPNVRNQQ